LPVTKEFWEPPTKLAEKGKRAWKMGESESKPRMEKKPPTVDEYQ